MKIYAKMPNDKKGDKLFVTMVRQRTATECYIKTVQTVSTNQCLYAISATTDIKGKRDREKIKYNCEIFLK